MMCSALRTNWQRYCLSMTSYTTFLAGGAERVSRYAAQGEWDA